MNKILILLLICLVIPAASALDNSTVKVYDISNAISSSENIIDNMKSNNFSIVYVTDALIEAKRIFEIAKKAEIIRNTNNQTEKNMLMQELALIDWQNVQYRDVLQYTDKIKEREKSAFFIFDSLNSLEKDIQNATTIDTTEPQALFKQAETAFYEDRYEDALNLISESRNSLETKKIESSSLSVIRSNTINFLKKHWIQSIFTVLILAAIVYFYAKKIEKNRIRKKIKRLKAEERAIEELMKKTQAERFEQNKISGLVYNIRMEKYKKKLNEIKEMLPVFEARLKK